MAPSTSLQARDSSGSMSLSIGAIVGIAVGGTFVLIAVLTSIVAIRRHRRRKHNLPRYSVNLTNTDIFLGGGSKSQIAKKEWERSGHPRSDSDMGTVPLLGQRPDSLAASTLRDEITPGKEAHLGNSPVFTLVNPYDEFGKSQSYLAPSMPEALSVGNRSHSRHLETPPIGINFVAPTPSPAPVTLLAKPISAVSLSASTPRAGISSLPPITIPPPPRAPPPGTSADDAKGPIMFSADIDTDADSASLYSLPSAPSRSSSKHNLPINPLTPPPVPQFPVQYAASNSSSSTIHPPKKREIDFRDVGLPNPHFPVTGDASTEELPMNRSDTAVIGTLLKKRAERVSNAASELERSTSQVSHIERAGSIRPAGEERYGRRLSKVRSAKGLEDVHVTEPDTGLLSTKASVHSKWVFDGIAGESVNEDGMVPPLPGQPETQGSSSSEMPGGNEMMIMPVPLTAAFTPSVTTPPTPPSQYPYLAGQDSFYAHTSPLKIRKSNAS